MVPHGVHMMHTYTVEIKEYDVKSHIYSMIALWWMSNRTWGGHMNIRASRYCYNMNHDVVI